MGQLRQILFIFILHIKMCNLNYIYMLSNNLKLTITNNHKFKQKTNKDLNTNVVDSKKTQFNQCSMHIVGFSLDYYQKLMLIFTFSYTEYRGSIIIVQK